MSIGFLAAVFLPLCCISFRREASSSLEDSRVKLSDRLEPSSLENSRVRLEATPQNAQTCDDVRHVLAGGHTCGDRIIYLVTHQQMTQRMAERKVATEFPAECGPCLTDNPFSTTGPPITNGNSFCGIASTVYQCRQDVGQLTNVNQAIGSTFSSMCMGYGGTHPPTWLGYTETDRDMCTLNINNDCHDWFEASPGNWQCNRNFGLSKNPDDCAGSVTPRYFFLWDEPQTQGYNAAWAAEQWKKHVDKWPNQMAALRARGTKVTSPLFTDHGGKAVDKFAAFFAKCDQLQIGCSEPTSNYYIDVLLTNQWLRGGVHEHAGQEQWIKDTMAGISAQWHKRPVVLGNFAWLGAQTADEQIDAITRSRIWDREWSGLDAVFYFAGVDYGGGTISNALASVGHRAGTTIGEALVNRCSVYT